MDLSASTQLFFKEVHEFYMILAAYVGSIGQLRLVSESQMSTDERVKTNITLTTNGLSKPGPSMIVQTTY